MTTTTAQRLSFHRVAKGAYLAQTDTRIYDVVRSDIDGAWSLAIFETREIAGVVIHGKHLNLGYFDTKRIAVAVAHAYADLGDDYRQCEHGFLERYTKAVIVGYETEKDRP